ncbi:MAG: hypothetical protein LBQ66_08595 [Planctomycetaceae bacterium]|nr:hypothetical protein [Planctomycetaceae bacterium]
MDDRKSGVCWRSSCRRVRRRYSPRKPGGRLPTLRLPTHLGVQFKLVWFPNAQRRAGHPRSSPPPLRGNCRLSPTLVVWYIDTYSAPAVGEYADAIHQESPAVGCPPYDHQRKKDLCGITSGVVLRCDIDPFGF